MHSAFFRLRIVAKFGRKMDDAYPGDTNNDFNLGHFFRLTVQTGFGQRRIAFRQVAPNRVRYQAEFTGDKALEYRGITWLFC